ncbi:MAG: glycosyltransferase family 4 protein [Pseudomonadota bacterium]
MKDSNTTTVLHLMGRLDLGGMARIMQGLCTPASRPPFFSVVGGLTADPKLVADLNQQGVSAGSIGEDLSRLTNLIGGNKRFVVVIHRSGEESLFWNRLLPMLRDAGAFLILNQNVFPHYDLGPTTELTDVYLFYSRDSMRQHWKGLGRPNVDEYLEKHRVLYCAVHLDPSLQELATKRANLRTQLGIPQNAFVIGDTCRPDARRLDIFGLAVFPRLLREVPDCWFVARRFPETGLYVLNKAAKKRLCNLPVTYNKEDMISTYAALDVFIHMTCMGESFGMVIGEAMRCGLPVIANETPKEDVGNSQGELVIHGETGFLANDPCSALTYLVELARSPSLRKNMGTAGKHRFTIHPYSPKSIVQQFDNEIARLAHRKGIDLPGLFDPIDRDPSDEQMRDFLLHHSRTFSVPLAPAPWPEKPWATWVNSQRQMWRVITKLSDPKTGKWRRPNLGKLLGR